MRVRNRIALFFSAVIIACLSISVRAETFSGKCVKVLDGDTIEVMHGNTAKRIRLAGVDCPEKSQDFGKRAKEFTAQQAYGQDVTILTHNTDRYGRTIAQVILPDGRSLNTELVRNGLAWWYRRYSADATLAKLEQNARETKSGLWSAPEPTPPWLYRRPHPVNREFKLTGHAHTIELPHSNSHESGAI